MRRNALISTLILAYTIRQPCRLEVRTEQDERQDEEPVSDHDSAATQDVS